MAQRLKPSTPGGVSCFSAVALSLAATACVADVPAGTPGDSASTTDTAPVAAPAAASATAEPDGASDAVGTVGTVGPAALLDTETALALAAMPLSCVDRPHTLRPDRAGYLDDIAYTRRRGFDRNRAFYGCWDWHSAVNSTWTMVRLMKEVPELAVTPLIREKLRDHLSEAAIEGELEYLTENPAFERPYGWAWLILLHAELAAWNDADASVWAERLEPVTGLVSERLAAYLAELEGPVRTGVHANTAFAIAMSLQATGMAERPELDQALRDAAVRFFAGDRRCPTAYEPGRSDFVSPCLEEAALMAMVMEGDAYVEWLDDFLPPLDSDEFATLRTPAPAGSSDDAPPSEGGAVITNDSLRAVLGARSHLIGLAFTRADAMVRIALALPADDPRVARLRELVDAHVQAGFETMFDADYAGSHWIGSFALKYLVQATRGAVP
ncbi:MAG: DUF2891 family protein [Gemmatimonadetes bacterium]|nr:DUF2891 family protein [Gemmatimonadota bacterium]